MFEMHLQPTQEEVSEMSTAEALSHVEEARCMLVALGYATRAKKLAVAVEALRRPDRFLRPAPPRLEVAT